MLLDGDSSDGVMLRFRADDDPIRVMGQLLDRIGADVPNDDAGVARFHLLLAAVLGQGASVAKIVTKSQERAADLVRAVNRQPLFTARDDS